MHGSKGPHPSITLAGSRAYLDAAGAPDVQMPFHTVILAGSVPVSLICIFMT